MLVVRQERESGLVRLSSCCVCLGFLSLVLASSLPMFVVTSFTGEGKILVAEFDVDVAIGDGLWKRNVCFGGSKPDEDLLRQFGLTCKGSLQTAHCEDENLSKDAKDRCEDYTLMQGMESFALFSTFAASFLGALAQACATMPLLRTAMRLTAIAALLIAVSASSIVIRLVKDSDMVDERTFACKDVFGAKLCHGYGPSFGLQWAAVGNLTFALLLNLLLLCVSPIITSTTTYQYVRVPLLQGQSEGVVISAPAQTQVPRAQVAAEMI